MTVSPSGSLFVAVAVSVSFVFGAVAESGLSETVAVGTRSHVTVLSVDVEAVFGLPRSVDGGAGRDRRDDRAARRHAGDRDVVGRGPAGDGDDLRPARRAAVIETSLLVKPVTGSLKTVKLIGATVVGISLAGGLVDRDRRSRVVDGEDIHRDAMRATSFASVTFHWPALPLAKAGHVTLS